MTRHAAGFGAAFSLVLSIVVPWTACGGGDETPMGSNMAMGGMAAGTMGMGGSGTVNVPSSCAAPGDCPAGYACVPPPGSFTEEVDPACYGPCSQGCEMAGPLKDMCLQTCNDACKRTVPTDAGAGMGTCMMIPQNSGAGGSPAIPGAGGNTVPAGTGGSTGAQAKITWAGTWSAEVSYTAKCSWANSAMQMGNQKHTVTVKIEGANDAPKMTINGGYDLEGPGSDSHMTLSGDFPLRNYKGDTATQHSLNSPNEVTIKMTTVESATRATGTIEGSFDASGGWKCTVKDGTIVLSK